MMGPFRGYGLVLWGLIPFAILYSIWKERNYRIFKRLGASLDDLLDVVCLRIRTWVVISKEYQHLNLDSCSSHLGGLLGLWCIMFMILLR